MFSDFLNLSFSFSELFSNNYIINFTATYSYFMVIKSLVVSKVTNILKNNYLLPLELFVLFVNFQLFIV